MPQNPHEPWLPPAQYYRSLIDRARKHDPKVVSGAASSGEIARLEKLVDHLEKGATVKAEEKRRTDPHNIASGVLRGLWHRGHEARCAIMKMQTERLGKKNSFSDDIVWHPELQALNPPPDFFKPPNDLGGRAPEFKTPDEADSLAAELSVTVTKLETLAAKMSAFLNDWEGMIYEQQTRRLVMAHINAGKVGG